MDKVTSIINRFKALSKIQKASSIVLASYGVLIVGFSFFLRPVSDAYIYAQTSATFDGPLGSAIMWFTNHNSLFVREFADSLLVGFPLLVMPWWLSTSFTFLVNAMLLSLAAYNLRLIKFEAKNRVSVFLITAAVVNLMWLSYWFVYSLIPDGSKSSFMGGLIVDNREARLAMFYEIMEYQTGVMNYVGLTSLAIIFLATLNRYKKLNNIIGLALSVLVSIFIGQSNVTSNMLFIILLILALVSYRWLNKTAGFNYKLKHLFAMLITSIITIFLVLNSQTGRQRSIGSSFIIEGLPSYSDEKYPVRSIYDEIAYTLTHTFMDSKLMLLNFGTLVFLLCSLGLGILLRRNNIFIYNKRALLLGLVFMFSGLIMASLVAYSHIKIYVASWHQMQVGLFYYLGLLMIGLWLSGLKFSKRSLVQVISSLLLFAIVSSGLYAYTEHAVRRQQLWEQGSVSSGFSTDISTDWAIYAWNRILEHRGESEFRKIRELYAPALSSPPYAFIWEQEKAKLGIK